MDKDNVQHGTIPNEQSLTGSDTFTMASSYLRRRNNVFERNLNPSQLLEIMSSSYDMSTIPCVHGVIRRQEYQPVSFICQKIF